MNDIVDNLKKLANEHEKHLSEIRQKISSVELIPKAKSLVGKCFKYPNTYTSFFGFGMSGRVKYKGYIYKRITACDKEYVIVDTFFQGTLSKFEVVFEDRQYVTMFDTKGLIQINEKEYFKAFNKMLKQIFERGKKEK